MSDPLKPPTTSSDFEQHPAGSYMAVCADVYVKQVKNGYFGQPRDQKNPDVLDDREFVNKAIIVFLTSHPSKEGKPSRVDAMQSFAWGGVDKPSNLFKLVKGWFPTGTDDQIRNMSLSNLIGKSAWITVENNVSKKNGKLYANVTAASTPPPGVQPVAIPADFKRYEQRQAEQPVAQVHQPVQRPVFAQQAPPPATQYPGTVVPPQAPMPTQQPQHITSEHDDLPW